MLHDDYLEAAEAFRLSLAAAAAGDGTFPEAEDWLSVQALVTCETDGCPHGRQLTTLHENADGRFRAVCGHCHRPITNVMGLFDDGQFWLPV